MIRSCLLLLVSYSLTALPRSSRAQAPDPLSSFTPAGMVLLDSAGGDLNGDKIRDLVMVCRSPLEDSELDLNEELARPALILFGVGKGRYTLAARNDSIVLCKNCGGVFGDPWTGITVKGSYFSLEFYGGSSWRWMNVITFKYEKKRRAFYLHRDAGLTYHTSEPNKTKPFIHHRKSYGKLRFEDYRWDD